MTKLSGRARPDFFYLCALLVFSLPAFALDPIDTDGPDFVESSEVVPMGHFQYEVDMTSTNGRYAAPPITIISTPALLKYGFAENFELRIAPEGYMRTDGTSGVGDTAFGLKWHALGKDPAQGIPSLSWLLHFDTQSGSDQFRGIGVRPSLRSVATWDLLYDFALGLMPGIKYDTTGDGQRFVSGIFGAVLNRSFNDKFRAFIELSVPQIAHAGDGGVSASADVGAAYLVNNDLQLGVRAGAGLNRFAPNSYVLFEIAQRF
jgi:hypothetical protein